MPMNLFKGFSKVATLFIFSIGASRGQDISHVKCWSEENSLIFSDFQGQPKDQKETGYVGAETATPIFVKGIPGSTMPNFQVIMYFDKKVSWIIPSLHELQFKELLAHEQLHFDISELYARKIRKAVDSLRRSNVQDASTYQTYIKIIFNDWHLAQDQYDAETATGLIEEAQVLWNRKVKSELALYSEYASNCDDILSMF